MPRTASGFTLVELAIALMVIGLLIGGVLKGQELVENAKITQTIRQFKAYETAAVTFKSIYTSLPGDLRNPGTRLPNCAAPYCNLSGNKDGKIGAPVANEEQRNFWVHMAKAGVISGLNTDMETLANNTDAYKKASPAPSTGGYFWAMNGVSGLKNLIAIYPIAAASTDAIKPDVAAKLDQKMDDGKYNAGKIIAIDITNCINYVTMAYNETNTTGRCLFYAELDF